MAPPKINRNVALAALLLLVVMCVAIFAAFRFVEAERTRELAQWQIRLGIVADSRAQAITDWVDGQAATLQGLAENASLQVYLTELALAAGDQAAVTDAQVQAEYLTTLLTATAHRSGFVVDPLGPDVQANVERVGVAGIALTEGNGHTLAATEGMPPMVGELAAFVAITPVDSRGLAGPVIGSGGAPVVRLLQPVFAVQGDGGAADVVGRVVGVRLLDKGFFDHLHQPGEVLRSGESYLVRRAGNVVEYLSPLADGTAALRRQLAVDTADLAAADLTASPGGFGIYRDYGGEQVLATSRAIAGTDWFLIRKVDVREALGPAETRLRTLLAVLVLIILLLAAAVVAVWRHGTSLRATEAAERYRRSSERLEALSAFLRLVTDSQPTAIAAIDADGRYTFANARAASEAGVPIEDMMGKPLPSVLGPAWAEPLEQANREAIGQQRRVARWQDQSDERGRRILKSEHIPLPASAEYPAGALMIQEDMTELVEERERRAHTLRDLVNTCVSVVDQRDPHSANHSVRVAEVARAIAEEMQLGPREVETCDVAGALLNLGKVTVSRRVLTKVAPLSEDELAQVRQSILTSADLVRDVRFDGPVYETIRQVQERWDGSGSPQGLAGENILQTARIVAVANAFVGMVSSRAYRSGRSFDEAARLLLHDADLGFDRRAVVALLNYLDNRGGRQHWSNFGAPPEAA